MDAARILGGLLSQRGGRTPSAGNVLGQVLNGISAQIEPQVCNSIHQRCGAPTLY